MRSIFALEASNRPEIRVIDVKTAFLRGKQIERTVYLQPSKEANTAKIWKLQECVYGLADVSHYWYLHKTEEFSKLGANVSRVHTSIFYWKENSRLVELLACYVDNIIWGDKMFEINIISKLKHTFQFGCEEIDVLTYTDIELVQDSGFGIIINQKNYISSVTEIVLPIDRTKGKTSPLTNEDKKLHRSAVSQLNWVTDILRPYISFSVCEARTKFKNATKKDVPYVNKTMNNVKCTNYGIKFPQLSMHDLKLQLFTDTSSNNLLNGRSQACQILDRRQK